MNEILITQIIAICTTTTMLLWLLFCPYRGKEFATYNKSRRLFIFALAVLLMQYVVNMKFGFRATNIEYGISANLFFYLPASHAFMLGMLNLQRAGHLSRGKMWHGIGTTLLGFVILTAGIFFQDGAYQWLANILGSVLLAINQTYFSVLLLMDFALTIKKIGNYFSFPAEDHVRWMWRSNILAIISFMLLPVAIHFAHVLTVSGILFWFAIIYYVSSFSYFGRYAHIVDDSYEEDEETERCDASKTDNLQEETPAPACGFLSTTAPADAENTNPPLTEEQPAQPAFDEALQQRIDDWIARECFCDNGVNIVQLASELNTNRTSLSRHINSVLGKNFREWINGLRIGKAKQLIEAQPHTSIEEVSALCGFSTRKYFDLVFALHEGKSAAEWRKGREKR